MELKKQCNSSDEIKRVSTLIKELFIWSSPGAEVIVTNASTSVRVKFLVNVRQPPSLESLEYTFASSTIDDFTEIFNMDTDTAVKYIGHDWYTIQHMCARRYLENLNAD